MKVILAGHNLDVEILHEIRERFEIISKTLDRFAVSGLTERELRKSAETAGQLAFEALGKENATPETLSAAYARITRRPQPIPELRRAAREGVSRARRSNQQIVFDFGHKSVAEHAVFNVDVLDISRLATEFIQNNRLCSFTEKSQRYIKFEEEVYIPPEFKDTPLLARYKEVIHQQFRLYGKLSETIFKKLCEENPEHANDHKTAKNLEKIAGEDARYILPLATFTQFGMTLNARALEWMAWKANAYPLQEIREFADTLLHITEKVSPSLVRYTSPSEQYLSTKQRVEPYLSFNDEPSIDRGEDQVRLIAYPEQGDDQLLTALLFGRGKNTWQECQQTVQSFDPDKKKALFCDAMKGITVHDPVWREFETLDFDIEIVLSASAFAQLKRHRMSSQLIQPYDPELGVMVPPAVISVGLEDEFSLVTEASASVYQQISRQNPANAEYILTNGHCRRVLLHANARELYHMTRLRMDQTAQWEIRSIVSQILSLVTEKCPLTFALASGKDAFDVKCNQLYTDHGNI